MLYIVSATYDYNLDGVVLKLYNDETQKIEEWADTDFKPYFLSRDKITYNSFKGIIEQNVVQKYNALTDKNDLLWKVVLDNPQQVKQSHNIPSTYENHIKFYQCYIYDKGIKMGMPHHREDGKLVFAVNPEAEARIEKILSEIKGIPKDEWETYKTWAELLEYPAPFFKRASLDIEVYNEGENKIPNAESAILPVLTICFCTIEGERIALVLLQEGKKIETIPDNITAIEFFSDEEKMLERAFEIMNGFPFIITFNGDDFDLKYLYHRALRLGVPKGKIPIIVRQNICLLRKSIHIDLYRFFFVRAIKIYAFKGKYKNIDLESVSQALLGRGKTKGEEKWVAKMSYYDLIKYCTNDADLTLELTTFNNNIVMNLILVLQRMSRMPIENVCRKAVSSWIRTFMMYEHRKRNILIPNPEEIKSVKGQTASEAIIKGKKYKGAIVFEPVSGTHFSVLVLDFASLYPSIMKVYNIGYSTINCPHEECKDNKIGELSHWICKKKKALEAMLIGSLRDLRVNWYKPKAKDDTTKKDLKQWYSVAEQSIKVIMNASYGVFGSDAFPLYCPPLAEEITAIARYIIKRTAEHAQSIGIKVLYGDTDSIFIVRPSDKVLKELIKWTEKKYGIDFEVDKEYRYVCLSGRKKNYLGVFKNGEVDVKGMTGKKKHAPSLIKEAFRNTKEILGSVKTKEELEKAKSDIIKLVCETHKMLKERRWKDINGLAFDVTMSSNIEEYTKTTPQHVKAAQMLIERGYKIEAGYNVRFVKTRKKVKTKKGYKWVSDVKPVELAKREEVDVSKYIEFLKSTFEQILDPLGINFDEDILGITRMDSWLQ